MPNFRQVIDTLVCEGKAALIELQLTDEANADLPKANLDFLTLTLYNASRGSDFNAIINDREQSNILDTGGGTVTAGGLLRLKLSGEDNQMLRQSRGFESHVALIEWDVLGGGSPGAKELAFTVANQSQLPHSS